MTGRTAYLVHLLAWALPLLAGQLALLGWHYRARTRGVLRAVVPPALAVGTWLSAWDHLAIAEGVWRFGEGLHLGVYVGRVPLEEVLFFYLTSLLVSLGLALFSGLLLPEARRG